jgi:nitrite reductase/ring-hydroxylating ferredoxin subunit
MLSPRFFINTGLRQLVRQAPIRKLQLLQPFTTTSRIMAQEYKLKGLSSLDLKPGEKREVEVEGIEEGKVLLCNVGGKTTALGSKCTHYGAPLVKGVLTGGEHVLLSCPPADLCFSTRTMLTTLDGRITCPWHGACFNAKNGDIENAPAIDALPSFELSEKNGSVYITGEQQSIKGSRRKPNIKISGVAGSEKVVIVGGGSGALGTLEALRENGFKGSITLIGNEGYPPIDRTKL